MTPREPRCRPFEDAASRPAAERHIRDVGNTDGTAVGCGEDDVFEVAENALRLEAGVGLSGSCAEPGDAAGNELGVALVDDIAADGRIERATASATCDGVRPCAEAKGSIST
jgi:hypothetical protein